jgi:hypothetical protein
MPRRRRLRQLLMLSPCCVRMAVICARNEDLAEMKIGVVRSDDCAVSTLSPHTIPEQEGAARNLSENHPAELALSPLQKKNGPSANPCHAIPLLCHHVAPYNLLLHGRKEAFFDSNII